MADEITRTENQVTESGNRMLDYYPEVIKRLLEFKALMFGEGFEIDSSKDNVDSTLSDAYLETMGEDRIEQWEQVLRLTPSAISTLENRRDAIKARIRGNGKLNTAAINLIVSAFTNGTAESYFKDSTLYVKIKPPPNNKQYIFSDVETELKRRIPAHIGLKVSRDYSTWGEIKNNFASWQTISEEDNWKDIMLYVTSE